MRKLLCLLLLVGFNAPAAFTEFYCINTAGACGSNVFSGSTSSTTPAYSAFNGNWDGTSVYTPTDGSTPASSVSAGDWASVYVDGEVITKYIARVVTVAAGANGAITLSTTAVAGTAPGNSATARTIRVGGAWHGPGTVDQVGGSGGSTNYFPFDFVTLALTNTSSNPVRVNFNGGTAYSVTNAITHSKAGAITFAGYTNAPGDSGRAIISGGTTVAAFVLLTTTGANLIFQNLWFDHNGASGNQVGVNPQASADFYNCKFSNMGRAGIQTSSGCRITECDICTNNVANSSGFAGINSAGGGDRLLRCWIHDNAGANSAGINNGAASIVEGCIIERNGGGGITGIGTELVVSKTDFYKNIGAGIDLTKTTPSLIFIENCNFFTNSTYGIHSSVAALRGGIIRNCVFGSGTMTNTSGGISAQISSGWSSIAISGTITYAADSTPWTDPDAGNFTPVSNASTLASGWGAFDPANSVSFPYIGSAQPAATNTTAAASGGSYTFAQ